MKKDANYWRRKMGPPTVEEEEKKFYEVMERLLAEKGIKQPYEIFSSVGEGKLSPEGIESDSGSILTSDGRVFDYWFEWDEKKNDYTLGENKFLDDGTPFFCEGNPTDHEDDAYYQIARKRLGLSLNRSAVRKERRQLTTLLKRYIAKYTIAPKVSKRLHRELNWILVKVKQHESLVIDWVKQYLSGLVRFDDKSLTKAVYHGVALDNTLLDFRNKTHDQVYDPYIDWSSSITRLAVSLEILANLEGKVRTIFVRDNNHNK